MWTEVAQLQNPDAAQGSFGTAVALRGDTLAVSAPLQDVAFDQDGAVHLFRFMRADERWVPLDRLSATRPSPGGVFGVSIAISDRRLAVGASADAADGDGFGWVEVFRETSSRAWIDVVRLTPSDASSGQRFGRSLALSPDLLIVGADVDGPNVQGAAYGFSSSGETESACQPRR